MTLWLLEFQFGIKVYKFIFKIKNIIPKVLNLLEGLCSYRHKNILIKDNIDSEKWRTSTLKTSVDLYLMIAGENA